VCVQVHSKPLPPPLPVPMEVEVEVDDCPLPTFDASA
jgi:hypothetical protein